jgi:hypothetical protein
VGPECWSASVLHRKRLCCWAPRVAVGLELGRSACCTRTQRCRQHQPRRDALLSVPNVATLNNIF